jgi:NAD(P)-dependent dehydrogenase (short-subunit alcohol dehydrogenase family)
MTLEGKVALITGAGSGIGRGTAVRLARDGANICIADIDVDGAEETASMVREFGRDAITVRQTSPRSRRCRGGGPLCSWARPAGCGESRTPASAGPVLCWTWT